MTGVLQDKVALITGAAGGIGATTARAFAKAGAALVLVDRDAGALDKTARELAADGVAEERVLLCPADVTLPRDVEDYVEAAESRFGRLDVLFNNAGIEGCVSPITDYDEEEFERVLRVNVTGVWLNLKYGARAMTRSGGGSIVNTSSGAGLSGLRGLAAYVASKHAVVGLTRTAALELAADNVRVNAICPGPVETRMMTSLERMTDPDDPGRARELYTSGIPMARYARREEVAQVVLFLASDAAPYITGATISIDGGFSAG